MKVLVRFLEQIRAALAADDLVRDQVRQDNLRQVRFGAALLGFLSLTASAFMLPHAWSVRASPGINWQLAVGMTHLIGAASSLVLVVLAHRSLTQKAATRLASVLPPLAAAVALFECLALTLFYQWVEPKTSPMTLAAIGVALLLYLRPTIAAALYASVAVLGFWLLPLTQTDPALLASARVSALVIPFAGFAFSVLSWRRNTVKVLLDRSLEAANEALALKQIELEKIAWYDGLTGLCNRSEFMRRADLEVLRAERHGHETSFLLIDLDHFKKVNDRFGHPIGHLALRHVAALLKRATRETDLVARLGGEEFIVQLPQTDLKDALACAEKLRASVQEQPMVTEQGLVDITVSLGVLAVAPHAGADMSRVYAAIDRALYRAKEAGRNCVETGALDTAVPSAPQAQALL